ncbi:MAG: phosphatase [Clostridia bacterium]|nr:phosphatase [Clostridia bacterium]
MRIKFDTHTHTLASAHAYSTVAENAAYAARVGMDGFAVTEHGPAMPDAPHEWFFHNLKNLPGELYGQKMLIGAEVDLLDKNGKLDLGDDLLSRLDVVGASIHGPVYADNDAEDHTSAYEAAVLHPNIDILCHSGSPQYKYDYEYIIKLARDNNKLIEINNHSFFVRRSSIENCRRIAELCKKYGTGITVSSDAHFFTDIGNYAQALEMLDEIDFPEELVMNTTYEKFETYLREKRGKEPMKWRL